ncbi:hepatic leukemia factor-like [Polypterus senegalus]
MARPMSQLIPPDLPGSSPQYGTGGQAGAPQGGHSSSMASLKSLLQLPIKQGVEFRSKELNGDSKVLEKEKLDPDDDCLLSCGLRSSQSAFLVPLLWEKTLPCDGGLFQLQYMDLEEFLTENGMGPSTGGAEAQVPSQRNPTSPASASVPSQSGQSQSQMGNPHHSPLHGHQSQLSQLPQIAQSPSPTASMTPGSNGSPTMETAAQQQGIIGNCMHGPALQGQVASPDPSNCPQMDGTDVMVNFDPDPADLALSSVPGQEAFDPRRHRFSDEELKPQPMIKKARKMLVPDEQKDEKYWSRRYKNNEAAKRSRDARRLKENQISVRAAFLEKENAALRQEVAEMRKELGRCRNVLTKYESRHGNL